MSEIPESLPPHPDEERREAELESAMEDALDGTPRASELQALRDVLAQRQKEMEAEMNATSDPEVREKLRARLSEMDAQIAILEEEANINKFIEDTARFSHEIRRLSEG